MKHSFAPVRYAWLQVACGELKLNGARLSAGDGAAIEEEPGCRGRETKL